MATELQQIDSLLAEFRRPCPDTPEYQDRLAEEFAIIIQQRFTDYFLKIRRVLDLNQDIPHMTRGSAGSSLVCYLMAITDVDPIEGRIPLDADYANYVDCASIAYPLRHFTDQDIWDYTEKFNLPIHHSRYEKIEGKWSERKDKRFNPDYFPACTACMVPESGSVPCPRLGGSIVSNISDKLRWLPKQNFSHMTSN